MALAKLLQRLKPFRNSRDEPPQTQNPTISAPFNIHTLQENKYQSLEDNPKVNTTPLRHTTGPGIQFMSDLHYERSLDKAANQYQNLPEIPKRAPYIILAGDIGCLRHRDALQSASRPVCDTYEKILFVPGNHEFWGTSRDEGLRIADTLSRNLGDKFAFLNRGRVDLEDVVVLGYTLHSSIPEGAHLTNDFKRIENWTVADHNAEHQRDLQWLKQTLEEIAESRPETRVVIATHYAPTFKGTAHPRFDQSRHRYCFSSNTLERFETWKGADQVSHWIFGHTHYNTVFAHGDTLVVSNQPDDRDCLRKFDAEATI